MLEADIWGKSMARRKTWSEKLENSKGLPKVEEITDKMSKRWGTGTVVIPAPMEVDEVMRRVPEGKLVTINEIRSSCSETRSDHWVSNNHRHFRLGCCQRR